MKLQNCIFFNDIPKPNTTVFWLNFLTAFSHEMNAEVYFNSTGFHTDSRQTCVVGRLSLSWADSKTPASENREFN